MQSLTDRFEMILNVFMNLDQKLDKNNNNNKKTRHFA